MKKRYVSKDTLSQRRTVKVPQKPGKRGRGRPRLFVDRYQVTIPATLKAKLLRYGDGVLSAGIVKAEKLIRGRRPPRKRGVKGTATRSRGKPSLTGEPGERCQVTLPTPIEASLRRFGKDSRGKESLSRGVIEAAKLIPGNQNRW